MSRPIDNLQPETGSIWLCGEPTAAGRYYVKGVPCPQRIARNILRGEDHGRSKLSDADAIAIIESTEPYKVLAEQYGVTVATIKAIRAGRRRPHLREIKRAKRRTVRPVIVRLSWKPPEALADVHWTPR